MTGSGSPGGISARRTTRLWTAPLPLAVALLLFASGQGGPGIVALVTFAFWFSTGIAAYANRIDIRPDYIEERGYTGGPRRIVREDVRACNYLTYRGAGRDSYMFFLEIVDSRGTRIKIFRFGWGRNTRPLFRVLERWLSRSPAEISAKARGVITGAAGDVR